MEVKNFNHYTDDFKLKVVSEVTSGIYSKETARRIYGIGGKSRILEWIRKFTGQTKTQSDFLPLSEVNKMGNQQNKSSEQELLRKIAELEKQLRQEQMKSGLWQTMVEVAEEKFGIEIKKKSGAQLSAGTKKSNTNPK